MGIIKEGFGIFNPIMLISRKVTKLKRAVTSFRHLNVRIAKNNLAYPLPKHTFSMLVQIPRRLDISPAIWQSYLKAILFCTQSRKYV